MPVLRLRRVLVIGVTALAALFLPATAAYADPLCNVNQNTWVRTGPAYGYPVMYTIPQGGGFRIEGRAQVEGTWYLGHGNGQVTGWIPDDGRLINCH